jgi:hypothetical protein
MIYCKEKVEVAAVAGSVATSSAMGRVRGRGCERLVLLIAQASLLHRSHARLLSVAGRPGLCGRGGAATVRAGGIFCMKVSFSRPSRTSYNILANPLSSTHSRYKSRRQEVTELRGGGSLPAADGVAVK